MSRSVAASVLALASVACASPPGGGGSTATPPPIVAPGTTGTPSATTASAIPEPWAAISDAGFTPLVADFDGDGVDDLAVWGWYTNGVAVHFGPLTPGTVAWDDAETLVPGCELASYNAAVDADGDGLPELPCRTGFARVVRGATETSYAAAFSYETRSYYTGDFDGDGLDDLVIGTEDPSGQAAEDVLYGPLSAGSIDPSTAALPAPNAGRILLDTAVPSIASPWWVVGDLDGDGYPEITRHVSEDYSTPEISILYEIGDLRGRIAPMTELVRTTDLPVWKPIGDWDADGRPDLYGGAGIWSGAEAAQGVFAEPILAAASPPDDGQIEYGLPDFDDDGVPDLSAEVDRVENAYPDGVWALASSHLGAEIADVTEQGTMQNALRTYVGAGDFDGDGMIDLVCGWGEQGFGVWSPGQLGLQ